jgi:hypothetical protein
VESQAQSFDNEDLSWMDLDPLPHPEVQIPSRRGELRWNPSVWSVIAQFVGRIKGYKIESQTGVTRTNPTQCHHNGMVLSF